jgi:CheY-like chemotaxis protein
LSAAADAPSGDARLLGLLEVMRAHLSGDADARMPVAPGEGDTIAELCRVFNAVAERAQGLQSGQLPPPRRPMVDADAEAATATQADTDIDVDIPAQVTDSDRPPAVLVVEAGSDTAGSDAAADPAETDPVGPMRSAAHTALHGLGGVWSQAEVLTVRSPAEALAATATRRVVSVLVDARGPLGVLLAILAALVRGRARAEIVRSPEQAVERLTLHWLTGAPGISDPHPEPTDPGYGQLHFKGEKALVVDDDVRNVFAMVSALELHGLTALTADSGPEAVEILRRTPDISIVLMDLMMPGMDGYTTTARIREHPEFARLPIIAVTARAAAGDRERSLAAGLDEHVTKPVKVDRLLTLVRQLIGT